jgi:hypothetical protein
MRRAGMSSKCRAGAHAGAEGAKFRAERERGPLTAVSQSGFGDPRHGGVPHYQQHRSPQQGLAAGNRMPRTTVASMSTAAARPTPSVLVSTMGSAARMENTATMITAALVATPALREAEQAGELPAVQGRMRWRARR